MMSSNISKLQYNERAWAIDLISAINKNASPEDNIQRASGEFSLEGAGQTLFPDVVLFGDASNGNILQGWELKMPDTAIDDAKLLDNAAEKARRLRLNSFLVWNAVYADLYIKDDANRFIFHERLHENSKISSRSDIANHPDLWMEALKIIIDKLNNFFTHGIISGIDAELLFINGDFIENILQNQVNVRSYIEQSAQKDNRLKAKIDSWWKYVSESYPDEKPYSPLAYSILLSWINRFIFVNILKNYNQKDAPTDLKHGISIKECIQLFSDFSKARNICNFFQPTEFDELIPTKEWETLLSFNKFLNSIEFSKINIDILRNILHATTLSSIKNAAGLFVTPQALAYLLVYLALRDKTEHSIDPFCGTGTIVNAMMSVKSEDNIPKAAVLDTTWGSDKFTFPIQIATIALFSPENIGRLMKIFTSDVLNLQVDKDIKFIDPSSGKEIMIKLPLFSVIASNLPFINFSQIPELNAAVWKKIASFYEKYNVENEKKLSHRSDFYAYMPFILYDLLDSDGTLGIITSNSWLSTEWGVNYKSLLRRFYNIDYVLVSANGRWFKNTDVVSTILICSKRKEDSIDENTAAFVSIKQSLDDKLFDPQNIATSILAEDCNNHNISIKRWKHTQITAIEKFGFGWIPLFSDLSWFLDNQDKFKQLNTICNIIRGERRGWDKMFILSPNTSKQLDKKFLSPYLKNINRHYDLTIDSPDSFAFVCFLSPEDLQLPENISARKWIESFSQKTNNAKQPLKTALKTTDGEWYQFKIKAYADFILPLNPDTRLHVVRATTQFALNQRLICLSLRENYSEDDIVFFHAILNSTVSMLMIEMLGFGRGLGVLDITSTKIKTGFWIFDPALFTKEARNRIITSFVPLLKRKIKTVPDEIKEKDRRILDETIFSEIGIDYSVYGNKIYDSLLNLYRIRKSVI